MTDKAKADQEMKEENLEQAAAPSEDATAPNNQEANELKAAIEAGDFDINDFLTQYKEAISAKEEAEARALRVQADFDNFRRRSRKETEEAGKRANADLITTILPVLDNFERALKMMQESAERDGVEMILKQMQQVLENVGLQEIEAQGAVFDPNIHQAVLQEAVDDERKGKVLMVMQKGYLLGDKLIRAAVVQVGV
ncbi:MAG: nucleotide exchange factor GrpE [Firmicutes bacterium]|nr:nucleotide exchange factor GrpE [Bacillota bacterium]